MSDWSVTVGDLAMGPGTSFGVTKVDGWLSLPNVRAGTVQKSGQSGDYPAYELLSGRTVSVEFDIAGDVTPFPDSVALLESLKGAQGGLMPITMQLPGRNPETVYAYLRALSVPTAQEFEFGLVSAALQVYAPDPLRYGAEEFAQAVLGSVSGGTGLAYPLVYPLDYGVPPGVTPGALVVRNSGTSSYFPRMRIVGPVTNPVVTLVETGDWVKLNLVVAAGQHADINWGEPRRVTLGDNPVSVRYRTSYSGNFLAVPVGGGSITFSADDSDPAASLSVWSYEGVYL